MKSRAFLPAAGAAAAAVLLLTQAETAAQAVREGISLCLTSVVPSLFPFFVLSSLLTDRTAAQAAERVLGGVFRRLFRCGGAGSAAFLLGCVGGYPVGARTAAALVHQGTLSPDEGERLLTFCNNAGPAFTVGVAGLAVFHSPAVGAYLYLLHITSALLTGLLLCPAGAGAVTRRPPPSPAPPEKPFPLRFLQAVEDAASAMGRVCAFVVFFLVLLSLTERVTGPLPPWAAGFLELTNGVLRLSPTRTGFITAAALLGWGGLSVHCQTASVLDGTNVPLDRYFLGKALQSLLSALLAAAVWHVIPPAA